MSGCRSLMSCLFLAVWYRKIQTNLKKRVNLYQHVGLVVGVLGVWGRGCGGGRGDGVHYKYVL